MEFNHDFYNQIVENYKYSSKKKEDEEMEYLCGTIFFKEILEIIKKESLDGNDGVYLADFINESDFKNKLLIYDVLDKMGFKVSCSMNRFNGKFEYFNVSWDDKKEVDNDEGN